MDMRSGFGLLIVGLAAAAVCIGGCARPQAVSPETTAETAPRPGAEAAPPVQVRLTYSEKTCYLPVVIAVNEGFYEAQNLKIIPKIVTGGIESAEAVVGGQADLAVLGDAPTIIAMSRTPRLRLILTQALGTRMHRIVVHNDSGIAAPGDLAGKRVAVQLGSSTHGGFLRYCHKHGVDDSTINFIALSPRDFPEAMMAEQVDAIAGSEPWPGNTLAVCKDCRELANLEGLRSTYPLSIIGRGKFLDAHPGVASAIQRGTQKAVEFIHADPERASRLLSEKSGVSAERELKAMQDYEWLADIPDSVIDSLNLIAEFLKEQGKIDAIPDIEAAIDRSTPAARGA